MDSTTVDKMMTTLGPLRSRYTTTIERLHGMKVHVVVRDELEDRVVFEYDRNYMFLKTFEPFRLWEEESEQWRHFALISPSYVQAQILDLDRGEVIAKGEHFKLPADSVERLNKTLKEGEEPYVVGQEMPAWSFCPVEFFVPDFEDYYSEEYLAKLKAGTVDDRNRGKVEAFLKKRNFAFVAGCVWADDSSFKIATLDLTKVFEGRLPMVEDKFGYFVKGEGVTLKKSVGLEYFFNPNVNTLDLLTPVKFLMNEEDNVEKSSLWSDSIPGFSL